MATVVCLFPITIYQITGLILWWDAEECKEVQLTFFKTQLHLSECEPDLQVNGFFKLKNKKKDSAGQSISEVPNPMVIPRLSSKAG